MKIISEKYKGRNVIGYDITGTRPVMDWIKNLYLLWFKII